MRSCRHLENIRAQIFARDTGDTLNLVQPLDRDRDNPLLPPQDGCAVHLKKVRDRIQGEITTALSEIGKGCSVFHDRDISGRLCHFCKVI